MGSLLKKKRCIYVTKMTDVSTNINVSTAENGFIGANFTPKMTVVHILELQLKIITKF